MYRFYFFFALTFSISILTSCTIENSSDVNQDRIYQRLIMVYNDEDNTSSITVRFTIGNDWGNPIQLTGNSDIKFNNMGLDWSGTIGSYGKVFNEKILNGNFVYTNANNTIYTNTGTVRNIGINNFPTSLNKSQDYEFKWTGEKIISGEIISLYFKYIDSTNNSVEITQDIVNSDKITIPKTELQKLKTGQIQCYIQRQQIFQQLQQAPPVGGYMALSFYTKKVNVTIQ